MTTTRTTRTQGQLGHADLLDERFRDVFGRPPTPAELVRFQRARAGLALRLPAQVRRVAATLVATL